MLSRLLESRETAPRSPRSCPEGPPQSATGKTTRLVLWRPKKDVVVLPGHRCRLLWMEVFCYLKPLPKSSRHLWVSWSMSICSTHKKRFVFSLRPKKKPKKTQRPPRQARTPKKSRGVRTRRSWSHILTAQRAPDSQDLGSPEREPRFSFSEGEGVGWAFFEVIFKKQVQVTSKIPNGIL